MNVVALLGSPRHGKNSSTIAQRVIDTASGLGARTSIFELNRLSYRGCQGCYACKKGHETCVLKDDLTQVLAEVQGADLLVLASPVYYGDVTAQLKGFIDRGYSYLKPDYLTNPEPSRLSPKKLLFILTQGHPDEKFFNDIFPRYDGFLKWMGVTESRLVRACGVGPASLDQAPETALQEAEEAVRALLAP